MECSQNLNSQRLDINPLNFTQASQLILYLIAEFPQSTYENQSRHFFWRSLQGAGTFL
jgi:hypothetical protein